MDTMDSDGVNNDNPQNQVKNHDQDLRGRISPKGRERNPPPCSRHLGQVV